MYIVYNKEQLIKCLTEEIPEGIEFCLHNTGEYGEFCISLQDEDKENTKWFQEFVLHSMLSGEMK